MAKYVKTEIGYQLIEDITDNRSTAKYIKTETGFKLIDDFLSSKITDNFIKTEYGFLAADDIYVNKPLEVIDISPSWKYINPTKTSDYLKCYSGSLIEITEYDFVDFDSSKMVLSGDTKATGARYEDSDYIIYITPKRGYCWADGSTKPLTFKWLIVNIDWYDNKNIYNVSTFDRDFTDIKIRVGEELYVSQYILDWLGNGNFDETHIMEKSVSVTLPDGAPASEPQCWIKDGGIYSITIKSEDLNNTQAKQVYFTVGIDALIYAELDVYLNMPGIKLYPELFVISGSSSFSLEYNETKEIVIQSNLPEKLYNIHDPNFNNISILDSLLTYSYKSEALDFSIRAVNYGYPSFEYIQYTIAITNRNPYSADQSTELRIIVPERFTTDFSDYYIESNNIDFEIGCAGNSNTGYPEEPEVEVISNYRLATYGFSADGDSVSASFYWVADSNINGTVEGSLSQVNMYCSPHDDMYGNAISDYVSGDMVILTRTQRAMISAGTGSFEDQSPFITTVYVTATAPDGSTIEWSGDVGVG